MDKANKKITHTRQIDAAKPKDARYALTVGDGLSLYVMPKGTKKWVFRYSMFGKPKSLSLGLYPAVGLSEAKELRDQQRKLVAQGVDPSSRRKEKKLEKLLSGKNSFEAIANEWLE
ncbi:MAG: Arm DNA-binding domain-containing protein, partial [Porticoccaceae bacterium]